MTSDKLKRYLAHLESSYKSLQHPDFSFVSRTFDSRPYEPMMKRLRDYAAIEDLSASEDDVCFSYFLKGRHQLWKLDLSAVGPFGILVRLKGAYAHPDDFLYREKHDVIAFERKVIDLLTAGGIYLLPAEELDIKVPLMLFNTKKDEVTLYQALFSDRSLAIKRSVSVAHS